MTVTFYKPNELIAVIDQVQVNRLAKHIGNHLLKYAQEQIKFHNHQSNLFEISLSEINTLANVSSKNYDEIDTALKKLMQPVTIRNKDNPHRYKHLVPIYEIDVDTEKGSYRFRLAEVMIELLQNTDYFTKLDLHEFNDFTSKHSHVLFEWLKRYEHSPTIPQMPVEELRAITNTSSKKSYDNFAQIKKWVLDVAVAEICEKTPYQASFEPITERTKRRPKVTSLRWTFERKAEPEQKSVSNTTQSTDIHSRYAELATLYVSDGFCESEADFFKATYIADLSLLRWFYDAKKYMTKAKNKIKYLLGDIEKGTKKGRWQSQIEVYQAFFARLSEKDQAFMLEKQGQQGFYEQILILKEHLGDVTPVKDPENWL